VQFVYWCLTFLFLSQIAVADEAKLHICKRNTEVRYLSVHKKGANCVVSYAKSGEVTVIGRAQDEQVCAEIIGGVIKNLSTANWKCRETTGSISN
jgi:hypothetical protein